MKKRHRVGGERRARGGGRAPISSRVSRASRRRKSPTHEQFVIYNSRRRRPETRDKRASARRAPPRTAFRLFSLKRRERGAAGPARAGKNK
ncbi:hypothetical protein EVAR_91870_1 [Eumeta japonica]|uniref:Uncharacterized protein n=1 Tax=Eumeta variegata TaxID=151549 RepID=A0A4C1THP5_EUMVA|nr:hypothetical protein EVAR_91870_1 [Eumeta japonica]